MSKAWLSPRASPAWFMTTPKWPPVKIVSRALADRLASGQLQAGDSKPRCFHIIIQALPQEHVVPPGDDLNFQVL